MYAFNVVLAICVVIYLMAGLHAATLVSRGTMKEGGWLFNLSRYRGRARILAEAWETVFAVATIFFSFLCWWLVLPMYYTGPIAQERKAKV